MIKTKGRVNKLAREKKYTPKALETAIEDYFKSISRTVTAKEKYDTGKKDSSGHIVYAYRDIVNDDGEKIKYTEFIVPPSVIDLCLFLNISRQTLLNYETDEKYLDTITRARGRIEGCKARMLHTAKNVQGVMFDLECNHKWQRQVKVDLDANGKQNLNVKIEVVE